MMENYKEIEIFDIWEHLRVGRNVIAVIFRSHNYTEGLRSLRRMTISDLTRLLEKVKNGDEKNILFFEEIEVK